MPTLPRATFAEECLALPYRNRHRLILAYMLPAGFILGVTRFDITTGGLSARTQHRAGYSRTGTGTCFRVDWPAVNLGLPLWRRREQWRQPDSTLRRSSCCCVDWLAQWTAMGTDGGKYHRRRDRGAEAYPDTF